MSQQLTCMYRHAEGYGDLWSKQTKDNPNRTFPSAAATAITATSGGLPAKKSGAPSRAKSKRSAAGQAKSSEWVVIPVFMDIVRLALIAREECSQKYV